MGKNNIKKILTTCFIIAMIFSRNSLTASAVEEMQEILEVEVTIEKTAALVEIDENNLETILPEMTGSAASPVNAKRGQVVEYHILVKNQINREARSGELIITDAIPAGTSIVPGSMTAIFRDSVTGNAMLGSSATVVSAETGLVTTGAGETVQGVQWVLDNLLAGEEAYLTFRVVTPTTIAEYETDFIFGNTANLHGKTEYETLIIEIYTDADGNIQHYEEVLYTEIEYNKDSNVTYHIIEEATANVIKSSNPASPLADGSIPIVKAGEAIAYTIELQAEDKQLGVTISDTLPEGLLFVYGSITYTLVDGTVVLVPDSAFDSNTNTITWPTIDVEAGTTSFEFKVIVDRLVAGVYAKSFTSKAILEYTNVEKAPVESNEITHKTNFGKSELHKTAVTIIQDVNGKETIDTKGRGDAESPIKIKLGQIVEYRLTVDRIADEENRSGDIVVTDVIPTGTKYIENSIRAELVNMIQDSQAVIKSIEYTTIIDKDGVEKPGIVFVISGLANGERAELSFRVKEYESEKVFTNTANLEDEGNKNLVFEEAIGNHKQGETVLTEDEYKITSETTYHQLELPKEKETDTENEADSEKTTDTESKADTEPRTDVETDTNTEKKTEKGTTQPKTGDTTKLALLAGLFGVSLIITMYIIKRKQNDNKESL